ncbi:class I SAM-dependent methyltransferase [Quadrisphaera sp. DSM 44207]|uniref:class I SAM-dependent methyltransferase n=1 Tax=Quadrisphaera sp. DSM 44207 TaxID=1881057 RepID=UPI0008857F60|nr:methyltransferase [Quadrisphaera sp. DSM 44207]SDQ34170.1 Methyltransferase small domain-containing protein [Quadrisphaera sp. DSM 44207]
MSHEHYFTAVPAGEGQRRELRVVLDGAPRDLLTAAGVFSGDRLDPGTRVLLDRAGDPPPRGHLLDLGCGWGPIALALALRAPEAVVWAVDVNERALELVAENAARLGLRGVRAVAPEQVPDDVRFAAIWSNPPIRIGKDALHALLLRWLPRLQDDGTALLVVQKNLGADSLQRWLAEQLAQAAPPRAVARAGSSRGYRVLEVAPALTPGGAGGAGAPSPGGAGGARGGAAARPAR